MIEIDDAGGGCFIGPEVLVIHHVESGAAHYLFIPPDILTRVEYATRALKNAIVEMKIPKSEPIRLCRGEIFDPLQEFLAQAGFNVVREKVSAATDQLAEAKFHEILYSYGLPRNIALENRNYQRFYELIGCWYYSQSRKPDRRIRKARLKAPVWPQIVARKYPNLLRLLLEDQVAG